MPAPGVELQEFLHARLIADPGVASIVGDRIFDGPPGTASFPYLSFGPSQTLDTDATGRPMAREFIQIDAWARDGAGQIVGVKALMAAIKTALHNLPGALDEHALVGLRITGTRAFMDPDGLTAHGVLTVEALLEEN